MLLFVMYLIEANIFGNIIVNINIIVLGIVF